MALLPYHSPPFEGQPKQHTSAAAVSSTTHLLMNNFTNPCHWLDNHYRKTHPTSPELKQNNPIWVKDTLNKMEFANKGMPQPLRERSHWEMLNLEEALASLEGMPHPPSIEILACILCKCRKEKNPTYALRLHAYMHKSGLETHRFLGNYLVPMLVEVGSMYDAQQVFDRLVDRNEYSWTSLITGYMECGELQHAFILYQKMQDDSVNPNAYTFVALLKACARLKDTERGKEIHACIVRMGLLERNNFVGNALVDMYAKCGSLVKAQEVFDKLPVRGTVSWNALTAGYAEHGPGQQALNCFNQMQLEGISPDATTFVCSLKACGGNIGAIDQVIEIHDKIMREGLLERNPLVSSALVDTYAKCGLLARAQEVVDRLPVRDTVSWNALIVGYAQHGLGLEALTCFEQMQLEGISPDVITFVCSLKACGNIGAREKGIEIHAEIATKGLLEINLFVGSTLVDMYVKCGLLAKAQEVFDILPVRDAVLWNALIGGYIEHGLGQEALNSFEQMQLEGISPDTVTFVCSLKACASIGAIDKGREIHDQLAKNGILEIYPLIGSTLVDMYAKCGLLAKAQEMFDKLPAQDAVSWTALIAGFVEHGLGQEALNAFEQMQLEGFSPDASTFVCSLKACGNIGAIEKGIDIHAKIVEKGLLERDPFVGSTLVDMYAKCGLLAKAQEVFDELPVRDAVSWSALIAGYAHVGESDNIFLMLDRMRAEDIQPLGATFLSILNVCSHTGLVDKGQTYFEAMGKDYGISPTIEHYTCMIDLLGRAGQLDKAVVMIKKMPCNPNLVLWHTMLGACQKWGNVELGRWAFAHAVQLDKKDAAPYVLMSNIYADAHMQEHASQVEVMRLKEQAGKKPAQTWWTDVGGIVHSFLIGDTRHSQSSSIYANLEDSSLKMREEGYLPDLHCLSQNKIDEAKDDGLCGHNEKSVIVC